MAASTDRLLARLRADDLTWAEVPALVAEAAAEIERLQTALVWLYGNADEYSQLLRRVVEWTRADRAERGDGPAGGYTSRVEHAERLQQLGLQLLDASRQQHAALGLALKALPDTRTGGPCGTGYRYCWDESTTDEQDWVKEVRAQIRALTDALKS